MDTVIVNLVQEPNQIILQDSLVSSISNIAEYYTNEPSGNFDYSIFIPLVSALIGGFIAMFGQWFVRRLEKKSELKKETKEILARMAQLEIQLRFQLRDLAYFKQNTELQLLYKNLELDPLQKSKYYEEHYKSNLNIWECEKVIYETIANIGSLITKYNFINNSNINSAALRKIEFDGAKDYSGYHEIPTDTVISEDIKELNESYKSLVLVPIEEMLHPIIKSD